MCRQTASCAGIEVVEELDVCCIPEAAHRLVHSVSPLDQGTVVFPSRLSLDPP